jgi:branched-chain amino acid transport system permease protein
MVGGLLTHLTRIFRPAGQLSSLAKTRIILPLFILVLLLFPVFVSDPFPRRIMILIFLFAMLGQAWNILGGFAGQVSLGHAAFFGIGAYTSTILLIRLGITPWIGMIAGGLVAVILSQIIGYPSFRLSGHYFVIATIVLAEIIHIIFINWRWAGGAVGLTLPLLPQSLINLQFHANRLPYYYISLGLLAVMMLVAYGITISKPGYYFRAIKNDPSAASSLGINIANYKMFAIAISAFFTGVGGAFYAQFVLYIDPESVFGFMLSVIIMLIPVLGGIGTLWGPVLGAFILIPLSEYTRVYLSGLGSALDMVVYGLLILLVAIFEPRGMWVLIERFKKGSK